MDIIISGWGNVMQSNLTEQFCDGAPMCYNFVGEGDAYSTARLEKTTIYPIGNRHYPVVILRPTQLIFKPALHKSHLRGAQNVQCWLFCSWEVDTLSSTTTIRLTAAERAKLQRLAQQANASPSTVLRTLLRSAERITPAQPARAFFESGDVGAIRQDQTHAAA